MPSRRELPCHELRALYAAGQSTTTLAVRYKCSPTTVAQALRRCGAEVRRARFQAVPIPEALLRDQYLTQRLPLASIAANFGVSVSTIGNKRRRYGIPTRPRHL